jgi:tetratricopeptide (TPR) repeat protein
MALEYEYPGKDRTYKDLGEIYGKSSKHTNREMMERALDCMDRAIGLNGQDDFYYTTRAAIHCDIHQYEDALRDIEKALELNGKNGYAPLLELQILFLRKKPEIIEKIKL